MMTVVANCVLNFVFASKRGIGPMDLGLPLCLSVCGQRRRQPLRRREMMTVVANCVATVLVIYLSVAIAT